MRKALFFAILPALFVVACGGSTPGPAAPSTTPGASAAASAVAAPPASVTAPQTPTVTATPPTEGTGRRLEPRNPSGPSAEPGRGLDDVRIAVLTKRDQARACFDEARKGEPKMEGSVTFQWVIDPTGAVTQVAMDPTRSTLRNEKMDKCIISVLEKLHFAASPKGLETKTSYPFNFNPRSGGQLGGPGGSH